jgi:hypothetical protein
MFWLFQVPAVAIPRLSQFSGMDTGHVFGTTVADALAFSVFK